MELQVLRAAHFKVEPSSLQLRDAPWLQDTWMQKLLSGFEKFGPQLPCRRGYLTVLPCSLPSPGWRSRLPQTTAVSSALCRPLHVFQPISSQNASYRVDTPHRAEAPGWPGQGPCCFEPAVEHVLSDPSHLSQGVQFPLPLLSPYTWSGSQNERLIGF